MAEIGDRSFGGAMRSNDVREALLKSGSVYTLIIDGGPSFSLGNAWDETRTRRVKLSSSGITVGSIAQRMKVRRVVAQILELEYFDIIVARYVGLGLFVPLKYWRKMILDADDLLKSTSSSVRPVVLNSINIRIRNMLAKRLLGLAGHVWFVSPKDLARSRVRHGSLVINSVPMPNASRPKYCVSQTILMVGYFSHAPNAEGARWFVSVILPELRKRFPQLQLVLAGKHSDDFGLDFPPDVKILGFVPDISAEYDRSAIVIAPILSGGGTQIKVIDALAHGRPLVVSIFAHAGFSTDFMDGEHLLVAKDARSWVAHCTELLENPARGEAMGLRGLSTVSEKYSFERMCAIVCGDVNATSARVNR